MCSPSPRTRLQSYTRLYAACPAIERPATVAELRRTLALASECRRRVTFRAGGHSFDSQSLGDDLVISLERLAGIEVFHSDKKGWLVRVGAGATWGAIVKALDPYGLVPAVMVTSSHATAGGTLSGDCLSRFSSVYGREGKWVETFTLLTMDGRTLECSREAEDPLAKRAFYGAIGGLGYLGAVTEITYRVLRVRTHPDPVRVKSHMERLRTYDEVAEMLAGLASHAFAFTVAPAPALTASTDDTGPVKAPWATILRRQLPLRRTRRWIDKKQPGWPKWLGEWAKAPPQAALVFTSSYEKTPERRASPQDVWAIRWLRWWIVRSALLTVWSWPIAYFLLPPEKDYFEDVERFTFFMDGHTRAKERGNRLGFPMKTIQQTFVVPLHEPGATIQALSEDALAKTIKDRLHTWLDAAADRFATFAWSPPSRTSSSSTTTTTSYCRPTRASAASR